MLQIYETIFKVKLNTFVSKYTYILIFNIVHNYYLFSAEHNATLMAKQIRYIHIYPDFSDLITMPFGD